jgi:gliding motility-associated-like protein
MIGGSTNVQSPQCYGINNGFLTPNIFGGNAPYTYLWSTGQTTPSITGLGPGIYSVTISSGNSCPVTASYTLTDPQQIIPTLVTLNNVSCFGGNNGSAIVTSSGGTGLSAYTWSPGGFSGSTPTHLSAGSYTVTTTDGYGCTAIDSITITQPSQLTVNAVPTNATCGNSNGSAIATGSGGTSPYSYKWLPNNLIAASINGLASGNYSVTVTDANSCTANNNLTITNTSGVTATISSTVISCNGYNNGTATISALTGVSPYTYQWNNLQSTQTISSLTVGNYCGIITDANGCTDTLCTTLTDPAPIQVIANGINLCSGQSGTLTANGIGGTSPFTYSWNAGSFTGQTININPSSSATYSVIASDANGCSSLSDTATVNVLAPLTVSALSVGPVCAGSSAILTANALGGNGNYTFNWNPGNVSGNNISVTPTINTTYSVTLSDGCTVGSAQAIASVNLIPSPDVNFTSDFSPACAPSCINFTDQTTSASPILTWQWNFGDAQSSSQQSPRHCYASGGTYSVSLIATSVSGCIDSVIQNNYITLYNVPTALFIADPSEANLYEPDIQFNDQSTDAASWLWNFGDGNSSTEQNPQHTFTEQNTFPVVLIVTSPFGCIDSTTIDVNIKNDFTFYAPNAFTPNANGNNDIFLPKGTYWNPAKFNLHIFDRWGNLIFVSTNVNQGWDGKVKGGSNFVESDVYVWTVEISDLGGDKYYYTGSVTVVK